MVSSNTFGNQQVFHMNLFSVNAGTPVLTTASALTAVTQTAPAPRQASQLQISYCRCYSESEINLKIRCACLLIESNYLMTLKGP